MNVPHSWPALAVLGASYLGAGAVFIVLALVPGLPDVPLPLCGSLVGGPRTDDDWAGWVAIASWSAHFARRAVEVVIFDGFTRALSTTQSASLLAYYWLMAAWNGWALNRPTGYRLPPLGLVVAGFVTILVGEVGSAAARHALRRLRSNHAARPEAEVVTASGSRHVFPDTICFRLVSCPQYSFELLVWLGWALLVFTLPAFLLLGSSTLLLVLYSRKRHQTYREEFDGRDGRPLYPVNRRALIPFIF